MVYELVNDYFVQNLTNESMIVLSYLISNVIQADNFVYNFLLNSSNENFAVHDYRVHRILEKNLTLDEFINLYSKNEIEALQELFMYPIGEHEFLLLTNKIKCNKITIEKLFSDHKREPRFKLLRLLI